MGGGVSTQGLRGLESGYSLGSQEQSDGVF